MRFPQLKQGGSSLQEYLHHLVRLCARALEVAEKTIIDATVAGLDRRPCEEYLECRKPKTIDKLFEMMQEYCILDKGKRRRLEEMNEQRARNRKKLRPHQAD